MLQPKINKGGVVVAFKKTEPTFGYTDEIMTEILAQYTKSPAESAASMNARREKTPPTLCSAYERPSREEVILGFKSRYAANTLRY